MTEVTCAIIMDRGKVLFTQRSETMSHPLQWEFPGGKIMAGESPEKCLKREIMEELNVKVDVEQLLPSVMHSYGSFKIKLIPFICSLESGNISLTEHKDYVWIDKSEARKYKILDADLKIIQAMNGQWK